MYPAVFQPSSPLALTLCAIVRRSLRDSLLRVLCAMTHFWSSLSLVFLPYVPRLLPLPSSFPSLGRSRYLSVLSSVHSGKPAGRGQGPAAGPAGHHGVRANPSWLPVGARTPSSPSFPASPSCPQTQNVHELVTSVAADLRRGRAPRPAVSGNGRIDVAGRHLLVHSRWYDPLFGAPSHARIVRTAHPPRGARAGRYQVCTRRSRPSTRGTGRATLASAARSSLG